MATPGYNYMVQVDVSTNETPSWKALRIRGGSFPEINQVHGTVDITAHGDTAIPWRTHLLTLYEAQNVTVNVLSGGSADNQAALTKLKGSIGSPTGVKLRLVDNPSATEPLWQANYLVTGFTLRAPLDDAVSYDVGLLLNGAPTTHFAS